jgi:hypothetical protein
MVYGVVPYTISSGPLRTARTAARAADRPDYFGRLLSYSTVWDTTGYMRGYVCTGGGIAYQQKIIML